MTITSTDILEVRVRRRIAQGEGIVLIELVRDAGPLPRFEAGAHIDVHLAPGIIRQYSLCNDPADIGCYRLGVLRDPASRGGSVAVHETLREGARVTIGVPRNHFPLAADARHSVLVGGGIGVTPMIAMAYELNSAGRSFELHYCARTRAGAAFLDELAAAPFADRVQLHFDDEGGEQRLDLPRALKNAGAQDTHCFVCGPTGFMDWVIGSARAASLPEARIHREYFNAEVDTAGAEFEVVAAGSGKSVIVAADQTIVAALESIGVRVQVSCEEGVCGTCLCMVLEGECDHRDSFLTEQERAANDQILVCCSRAKSARLVLDI